MATLQVVPSVGARLGERINPVGVEMAEATILIIEDDDELREVIEAKLTKEGFAVSGVADGNAGREALGRDQPDLIILDLILPDVEGLTLCREVRESSDVLILILTGRTDEIDEVMGLETGADDYVTKPFSLRALTARIRALLRRQRRLAEVEAPLPAGAITPHARDGEIWVDELVSEEDSREPETPGGAGLPLARRGDLWRIDQRWHLMSTPKPPVNEAELRRNSMGIVDAGYIVEILGDADWIGMVKEVYLHDATTVDAVDQPIAHGYLIGDTAKSAELLQEGKPS